MKILIDINHPAHVHYFRNFIKLMQSSGNSFIITNRDQKIINDLLDSYQIEHIVRNVRKEQQNFFSSFLYMIRTIIEVLKVSYNKRIDLFLGFASNACSIASFFYGKPSIVIDDTEHNKLNHLLYKPFCSVILTPYYFKKKMGKKQLLFNAFVEQFYLHSTFYKSNFENLQKRVFAPYALIRYISYSASHDRNVKNILNLEEKKKIVEKLSDKMNVYITNESEDVSFSQYNLKIKPEDIHSVIDNAFVFITEGATMASEAGVLGTEYYYINPFKVGYIDEQCSRFENAHQLNRTELLEKLNELKYTTNDKKKEIRDYIEKNSINPTLFLVWFVENYPESAIIMKKNPDYQNRFK